MGFMDRLKGQFIEIIEWTDDSRDTLVWRFPVYDNEIKQNAQLTVRESQVAVFVNEGQVADQFNPGRYKLQTQNIPILSTLKGWKYGFASPYKAEVYFVNTRQFTDQKWGTRNPISLRDSEYGEVDIRAFGNYSYRCHDAKVMLTEVVGTDGHFTIDEINGQLKSMVISSFTDAVAESKIAFLDMAANLDELSAAVQGRMDAEFKKYGLELTKFLIENVSVPEEIQEIRRQRMKMKMLGLGTYQQLAAADAMLEAAKNPAGGAAAAGVGVGAGFMMGQQMMNTMQPQQPQQPQQAAAAPPPLPAQVQYFAAIGGAQAGPFDMNALRQQVSSGALTRDTLVWKQGMGAWTKAGEVAEIAGAFPAQPPPLPPPIPPQ